LIREIDSRAGAGFILEHHSSEMLLLFSTSLNQLLRFKPKKSFRRSRKVLTFRTWTSPSKSKLKALTCRPSASTAVKLTLASLLRVTKSCGLTQPAPTTPLCLPLQSVMDGSILVPRETTIKKTTTLRTSRWALGLDVVKWLKTYSASQRKTKLYICMIAFTTPSSAS